MRVIWWRSSDAVPLAELTPTSFDFGAADGFGAFLFAQKASVGVVVKHRQIQVRVRQAVGPAVDSAQALAGH